MKTRYVIRGYGKPGDVYIIKETSKTEDFKDNFDIKAVQVKRIIYVRS